MFSFFHRSEPKCSKMSAAKRKVMQKNVAAQNFVSKLNKGIVLSFAIIFNTVLLVCKLVFYGLVLCGVQLSIFVTSNATEIPKLLFLSKHIHFENWR